MHRVQVLLLQRVQIQISSGAHCARASRPAATLGKHRLLPGQLVKGGAAVLKGLW